LATAGVLPFNRYVVCRLIAVSAAFSLPIVFGWPARRGPVNVGLGAQYQA